MFLMVKSVNELEEMNIENGGIVPFSLNEGNFYFMFGRYCKEIKDYGNLWGELGGKIMSESNKNLENIVRRFWENSNGLIGSRDGLKNYLMREFSNLLVVYIREYNGVIIFLPIEYNKNYEKIFMTSMQMNKNLLDKKSEIMRVRKKGYMERDQIKWYKFDELVNNKKKFKNSNIELIDIIEEKFNC